MSICEGLHDRGAGPAFWSGRGPQDPHRITGRILQHHAAALPVHSGKNRPVKNLPKKSLVEWNQGRNVEVDWLKPRYRGFRSLELAKSWNLWFKFAQI